ncbi:MAG: hypothetical protein US54_C0026G0005 [Candidatus Roizmanbacteria bacterium GW2011_GWA2_37_7]|uniref:PIN domain-containing protein n=1 Tax=Candidatus Roizmanbacteria bacterium GW2011_GWA2_37_7 TaxID=1618481 RepID=A0A0G0KAZ0_9BACT|nr:MAG: hypothetical protein US54_C0026G0005 [Candidatus Roizmanbacteria bacterium GW2011_GWA2_37_7]
MKKVFFDSSVIIAAVGSKTGASARILSYCRKQKIEGYISEYVLLESKKNVRKKFNEIQKQRFNALILKSKLIVIEDPNVEIVTQYVDIISAKDTPVLAAAHILKVDYLITHNTKDFMKPSVLQRVHPIKIMTPKKCVYHLKKCLADRCK